MRASEADGSAGGTWLCEVLFAEQGSAGDLKEQRFFSR